MKKIFRFIIVALILLVFIGTFVYLYQRSLPELARYEEFTPKMDNIEKTTVITGKIEPRNEVNV